MEYESRVGRVLATMLAPASGLPAGAKLSADGCGSTCPPKLTTVP